MRKIRMAQIGTSRNSHGREIFATFASLSDIFEIVGYALPENERVLVQSEWMFSRAIAR